MLNEQKQETKRTYGTTRLKEFMLRMGGEAAIEDMYEAMYNRPSPVRRKAQQYLGPVITRFNAKGEGRIVPSIIKGKYVLIAND